MAFGKMSSMENFERKMVSGHPESDEEILSRVAREGAVAPADEKVLTEAGYGEEVEQIKHHEWDPQFPWIDKPNPPTQH